MVKMVKAGSDAAAVGPRRRGAPSRRHGLTMWSNMVSARRRWSNMARVRSECGAREPARGQAARWPAWSNGESKWVKWSIGGAVWSSGIGNSFSVVLSVPQPPHLSLCRPITAPLFNPPLPPLQFLFRSPHGSTHHGPGPLAAGRVQGPEVAHVLLRDARAGGGGPAAAEDVHDAGGGGGGVAEERRRAGGGGGGGDWGGEPCRGVGWAAGRGGGEGGGGKLRPEEGGKREGG